MALMTALGAFLNKALTNSKSDAQEINFIVRLNTFNLLDLRLNNIDFELPISKF